jgi:hypothetical protein
MELRGVVIWRSGDGGGDGCLVLRGRVELQETSCCWDLLLKMRINGSRI